MVLEVSDTILNSSKIVKEVLASGNEEDLNSIQQLISGFENTSVFNSRGRVRTEENLNNAMVDIDIGDIQIFVCSHGGNDYRVVFDAEAQSGFICIKKATLNQAKRYNHFIWRISGVINSGKNLLGQTVLFGKTNDAKIESNSDEELTREFFGDLYDQLHQFYVLSYEVQEGIVNAELQKYDGHKQLLGEVEVSSDIVQGDMSIEQLTINTSDSPDMSEVAEKDIPLKLRSEKRNDNPGPSDEVEKNDNK
ncbi:hypothetical protein ACFP3T_04510 [Lactiplantibacillus dongliensis]|uniref:Uncharacterized protein n=1 Tax=Lactiplantibacillus dongliensis TaxID=2559919 RepID=A0ABW1R330_9LACO|nr:hypothetical protein [Lactiplantibacillus dongliensis]